MEPLVDPAPLIVTLLLHAADQERFDRLRARHFPAERNWLGAHVTLFHALPGAEAGAVAAALAAEARGLAPFPVRVAGLRSLGRGVAFTLESARLASLRRGMAGRWAAWLTPQDRQGFRPHVTVQNKVTPEAAKRLLAALSAGFAPFDVGATGLGLWRYRGGPWEAAGAFPFTAAVDAEPGHRVRCAGRESGDE